MSMQTQIPARQPSPSASMGANRPRLASATIQAVDQIGVLTAREIESTAEEVMRGATEVASKLRQLAAAIRQHTEMASEEVADFCQRATSVFESVIELQESLVVNRHSPAHERAHDDSGRSV